jgi:hypothetical protein
MLISAHHPRRRKPSTGIVPGERRDERGSFQTHLRSADWPIRYQSTSCGTKTPGVFSRSSHSHVRMCRRDLRLDGSALLVPAQFRHRKRGLRRIRLRCNFTTPTNTRSNPTHSIVSRLSRSGTVSTKAHGKSRHAASGILPGGSRFSNPRAGSCRAPETRISNAPGFDASDNTHPDQSQTDGGTGMAMAGTSVATETCGQVRPLKLSMTFCVY